MQITKDESGALWQTAYAICHLSFAATSVPNSGGPIWLGAKAGSGLSGRAQRSLNVYQRQLLQLVSSAPIRNWGA